MCGYVASMQRFAIVEVYTPLPMRLGTDSMVEMCARSYGRERTHLFETLQDVVGMDRLTALPLCLRPRQTIGGRHGHLLPEGVRHSTDFPPGEKCNCEESSAKGRRRTLSGAGVGNLRSGGANPARYGRRRVRTSMGPGRISLPRRRLGSPQRANDANKATGITPWRPSSGR